MPNETVAKTLFMSKTLNKSLHQDYWVIRSKLSKQVPDTKFTRNVEGASTNLESLMQAVFIFSVVLNILIQGSLASKYFFMLLRSL